MGGKGNHPSSSESDDWGDESWIVDCPCGVNFDDGEEMVQCDECGVWVHTVCCRVSKAIPTYVCDKCDNKKKIKESEVAQLLVEFPVKPVSFNDSHTVHPPTEIAIEERAHVHGMPGGDPSFFEGVSKVFCRQLWEHTGYVPKYLKVDSRELPEAREDVSELMRNLSDLEPLPVSLDRYRRLSPVVLENGHAPFVSQMDDLRFDVLSNGAALSCEEAVREKEGETAIAAKGDGKSRLRLKPKVTEEKPLHSGKRVRDESTQKVYTSKKTMRNNGDVCKLEGGLWRKVDCPSAQEVAFVSKSPLTSPKNPKAMKKLAVLEFMDGDNILCGTCHKGNELSGLVPDATDGRSNSSCQECRKVRSSATSPKLETGILKQELVTLSLPSSFNTSTHEGRVTNRMEPDHCELSTRSGEVRANNDEVSAERDLQASFASTGIDIVRNDTSDSKKLDANESSIHESPRTLGSLKLTYERKFSKMKSETVKAKQAFPEAEAGEILEDAEVKHGATLGLEASVSKKSVPKGKEEVFVKVEGSRKDVDPMSVAKSATEAEARILGDSKVADIKAKQGMSVAGQQTGNLLENPKQTQLVSSHLRPDGCNSTTPTDVNGTMPALLGKVSPAVTTETMDEKTSNIATSIPEMKGQGSARTAGHLPASVRGKLLGERSNHQLQRSLTGGAGHSHVQVSMPGTARSMPSSAIVAVYSSSKNCSDDSRAGKQLGLTSLEGTSPLIQSAKQIRLSQSSGAHKSPGGEVMPPSQPSSAGQNLDLDSQRSKEEPVPVEQNCNDVLHSTLSPRKSQAGSGSSSDCQDSKTRPSQTTPSQGLCQQARQLNGIGHVYISRSKSAASSFPSSNSNCTALNPSGIIQPSQAPNVTLSNTKLSVSSLKSPSSGTSSSSPTSPLVTTPSSKSQPTSVKIPSSPPPQKSLSGGSTPNASNATYSVSKVSTSTNSSRPGSKQVGTIVSSKPGPLVGASPLSTKVVNLSKQSTRLNNFPGVKAVDGTNSVNKSSSVAASRGGNQSGLLKDSVKTVTHTSSKTATVGKANASTLGTKPPSSKQSHSNATTKGSAGSSISRQHPVSGNARSSASPASTKHSTVHHNKVGSGHKDEKSNMPSAQPVPKAMSAMPPPGPQVFTKRSPPTVLPNAGATTLKDEELALLLHQELNSSPRVPRVPRVRQAGASFQLVSSPSLSSAKGSFASATSGGSSHKDHQPAPRKRTREDRQKDLSKNVSRSGEEVGRSGRKRLEDKKVEDWKSVSEAVPSGRTVEGVKEKPTFSEQFLLENNAHVLGFSKGNLSIIVPGIDDAVDGDKKSPADSNVTLPGLIDEVLNRDHNLSYEKVCDAVLPHWPKLRKPNGERYAYPSHRQAVLDCLRNRSAWAHLVNRGPKTNLGRKRRRNDSATVSDTDEEEQGSFRDSDELESGKSSKRTKALDVEKAEGDASDRQKSSDAPTPDDVLPSGNRRARRRRKVAIEDGTDGEDEPVNVAEHGSGRAGISKSGGSEINQEEEPDAESSPSSEEAVSNYSEEDEEMVVHRGMRNRRRPTNESSDSEGDMD